MAVDTRSIMLELPQILVPGESADWVVLEGPNTAKSLYILAYQWNFEWTLG